MIELHDRLTIQETFENEDMLSHDETQVIMRSVEKVIEANTCGIELRYSNGTAFIDTLFCSNHRTHEVDEIIETYKNICEIAVGSYGMIYLRDDEDEKHFNEFQIYVFKKGQRTYQIDTNFSPCIPTIESDMIIDQS